jgi:hypothetical protein
MDDSNSRRFALITKRKKLRIIKKQKGLEREKTLEKEKILEKERILANPWKNKIGFIMLRHVSKEGFGQYWKYSYECIRKFYPENHILIIDDNSDYQFIDTKFQDNLYKTTIIQSEFEKRGELLPYYYYIKNKLFDIAVIIHDSLFINKYIDFYVNEFKLFWSICNRYDENLFKRKKSRNFEKKISELINHLDNSKELLELQQNKSLWAGSMGCMSVISHDFLISINDKYNFSKLLPHITSREYRMAFERVLAIMLFKQIENIKYKKRFYVWRH